MKPQLHPQLVNDPFRDPALYIDFLFEHRAVMFDLGDIPDLPSRKILRVSDIFISHTHMDHFMGFDRVLRTCVGRDKILRMYGPPHLIDQVEHKLLAYTWNLVENYAADFVVEVSEYTDDRVLRARFAASERFRRAVAAPTTIRHGILLDEPQFQVRAVPLDHKITCLAYALEEKSHVNVWKNRLAALGLPTGPWLRDLKAAIVAGVPDETPLRLHWRERGRQYERWLPLGDLRRDIVHVSAGQKIAYVVDAAYHPANAESITRLARGADILFIEAGFLERDAAHAQRKYHLTAYQAGRLAASANVKRVVPLHYSARYAKEGAVLAAEVEAGYRRST